MFKTLTVALLLSSCYHIEINGLKGHLEAFGEQGIKLEVQQVEVFLSPKDFFENHVIASKPLLMKGAAKASAAWHLWTDEYFLKTVSDGPSSEVNTEETKKENRSQKYTFMPFKKFLNIYNDTEIYMVDEMPRELAKDVDLPFSLHCRSLILGGLDRTLMWFSSGGTSSVVHHDGFENINCLYRGSKKLVMLNITKYVDVEKKLIDVEEGAYSSLDVDSVDLIKRPYLTGLEYLHVTMEPGDCLYIPLLWMHQVRSFGSNLAVNIWWNEDARWKKCRRKKKDRLTLARTIFQSEINSVKGIKRNIINALLDLNISPTEDNFREILENGNEKPKNNKMFTNSVAALYDLLDVSSDGKITAEDINATSTFKNIRKSSDAIDSYNRLVYELRNGSYEESPGLPLYIFREKPIGRFKPGNCFAFDESLSTREKVKKKDIEYMQNEKEPFLDEIKTEL